MWTVNFAAGLVAVADSEPTPLQATTRAMDEYFAAERYVIGERVAEIFRWVFLSVLLLLANLGAVGVPGQRLLVNTLLAFWALLNLVVTVLLLRGLKPGRRFGLMTLTADLVLSVALIYITDGFASPFFLAFFLAIIASAVRFGMIAGLVASLAICVMFLVTGGVAPVFHHPFDFFLPLETVGKVFLFLVVAVISGLVVQELDRERRLAVARAAEAEALHRMSVSLASSLETDTVLRVILEQAMALTGADGAVLVRTAEQGPSALLSIGVRGEDVLEANSGAISAALAGEARLSEAGGWLAVPIGEGSALLLVAEPGALTREKYFRVAALAASASVTMGNALQYQQRAREAVTDGLTGLFNTRELRRRLAAEHGRFTRQGRPYSLLLVDIDHFKGVNDSMGHQHGDHVLQAVADVVHRTIRAHDVAARYGGDELAVIALDTGSADASELAGRLLEAVRDAAIPAGPDQLITLSIGLAACPDDATGVDEIVMAADQALYLAKRAGRNRLATSSQLVAEFQSDPNVLATALKEAGPLVALAAARTLDWQHHQGSRHASRVAAAALTLANRAGHAGEELDAIRLVALLHELAQEEALLGDPAALLAPKFPAAVVHAVAALKGSLVGEQTPYAAKVVALADRYDEYVSGEGGGLALSPAEALERIRGERGVFDDRLVSELQELAPRRGLLHTDTVITPAIRLQPSS